MTKLFAISAFVNGRFLGQNNDVIHGNKNEEDLETEFRILKEKTDEDINTDDIEKLKQLKNRWNDDLKNWEYNFEKKNKRVPTDEDKNEIKEYYILRKEIIKKLKAQKHKKSS